jgi:hypothetical protein
MRVAWLAIASRAPAYDDMKEHTIRHLQQASAAGLELEPLFLYGGAGKGKAAVHELDVVYPDIAECLVPGVLHKTIAALRRVTEESSPAPPDYVIRTNLSTWFHWDKLAEFLSGAPRTRFAAGYSPDHSHLCGCCMVLSLDVARQLARFEGYDEGAIDDLAIAQALRNLGIPMRWVPRIDMLKTHIEGFGNELGLNPMDAFHYRIKSCIGGGREDRGVQDPVVMRALTDAYAAGERDPDHLLHRCIAAVQEQQPDPGPEE